MVECGKEMSNMDHFLRESTQRRQLKCFSVVERMGTARMISFYQQVSRSDNI